MVPSTSPFRRPLPGEDGESAREKTGRGRALDISTPGASRSRSGCRSRAQSTGTPKEDIVSKLLHRMEFTKELSSHEARTVVASPRTWKSRSALSSSSRGSPLACSRTQCSSRSPSPRQPMFLDEIRHHSSLQRAGAVKTSLFIQTSNAAEAVSLAKVFQAWAARTFPFLTASGHATVRMASLTEENRLLSAALRAQNPVADRRHDLNTDCELARNTFRRAQSDGVVKGGVDALRKRVATLEAERAELVERVWQLDVLTTQQRLSAALPCERCGAVAPWRNAFAREGEHMEGAALAAARLFAQTGLYIDHGGNVVL